MVNRWLYSVLFLLVAGGVLGGCMSYGPGAYGIGAGNTPGYGGGYWPDSEIDSYGWDSGYALAYGSGYGYGSGSGYGYPAGYGYGVAPGFGWGGGYRYAPIGWGFGGWNYGWNPGWSYPGYYRPRQWHGRPGYGGQPHPGWNGNGQRPPGSGDHAGRPGRPQPPLVQGGPQRPQVTPTATARPARVSPNTSARSAKPTGRSFDGTQPE